VSHWPENLLDLTALKEAHLALEQQQQELFAKPVSYYLDQQSRSRL